MISTKTFLQNVVQRTKAATDAAREAGRHRHAAKETKENLKQRQERDKLETRAAEYHNLCGIEGQTINAVNRTAENIIRNEQDLAEYELLQRLATWDLLEAAKTDKTRENAAENIQRLLDSRAELLARLKSERDELAGIQKRITSEFGDLVGQNRFI